MKPLSVGNVVSAGLRIYRDNFKKYYSVAFIAYLWLIVPIYGWAKFSANNGLIARLAYSEVKEDPESLKDARRYIKPRMWSFFGAAILSSFVGFLGIIGLSIVVGILGGIIGAIGIGQNAVSTIIGIALIVLGVIFFVFGLTWFLSRLLIYDLPLAIEQNVTAGSSIGRGWALTKGFVFKIQLIFLVAFLISLPISIFINLFSTALQFLVGYLVGANPDIFSLFIPLLSLSQILIFFASGAFLLPFWQAIKAAIYYDLRVRKEGLGLDLESADDFSLE